jgi:mannose-6-phosphate isomerase-like protein (cupin superfamily)
MKVKDLMTSDGVSVTPETPLENAGLPIRAASLIEQGLLPAPTALDVMRVKARLEAGNGGYEVVHASPGLEVGVYVLVAPEPDHQEAHHDDELYFVLDGRGVLDIEGRPVPLERGQAAFVPAGARHQFTAYELMSVLVVFARQWRLEPADTRRLAP